MIIITIIAYLLDFIFFILAFNLKHVLFIVAAIFFVLIVLAILKSFKLRKESEQLSKTSNKEVENKEYQDFTEGHLYENNDN